MHASRQIRVPGGCFQELVAKFSIDAVTTDTPAPQGGNERSGGKERQEDADQSGGEGQYGLRKLARPRNE